MWGTQTVGIIEYFDGRINSWIIRKVILSFSWASSTWTVDIGQIKTKINGNDSARGAWNFGDVDGLDSRLLNALPRLRTSGWGTILVIAQRVNAGKHLLDSFIEFIFICLWITALEYTSEVNY